MYGTQTGRVDIRQGAVGYLRELHYGMMPIMR